MKTMCSSLKNFAESISTITSDILGMNVDKIMGKAAEILRMLKLSEMLAQFSSEMLKLIECMGDVFHVVKDKISEVLPQVIIISHFKASTVKVNKILLLMLIVT